jgi:hypothetical protein
VTKSTKQFYILTKQPAKKFTLFVLTANYFKQMVQPLYTIGFSDLPYISTLHINWQNIYSQDTKHQNFSSISFCKSYCFISKGGKTGITEK